MRLDFARTAVGRDARQRVADGFNLLPWRPREIRRLRRRRMAEWSVAALMGCACAAPLAGWQMWQRGRVDARRLVVEASAAQLQGPFAEAQRLLGAAAGERHAAQLAGQRAKPLVRLLALLDGLANAGTSGVVLQQIVQHGDETELQAEAASENATAEWLGRLRAMPDVESVSVSELKRVSQGANPKQRPGLGEPIRVIARPGWRGAKTPQKPGEGGAREEVRNTE